SLYALGQIDLTHRARIDDLFYAIAHAVRARLDVSERSHRDLLDELNERLVDKYFVNFSVFESMPDVWAIDQVFPIAPIERLNERPQRRGVIADLTCDSDGKIDTYVETEGLDTSLPLHALKSGESYRLGFFLVGAYQ
ncbi:arginine decarboxylase, partial [Streptomyces sp. S9]|nr:arginine decarboxylase [Streptomyces sp. S9]